MHRVNAVPHGIDHVQLGHDLGQKRITITPGRFFTGCVIFRRPLEEAALVFKYQLIGTFRHQNAAIAGVILMGDAVVQGLENNLLVVLRNLDGQQRIIRQNPQLDIANIPIKSGSIQQKRRAEMLIGPLGTFELPSHLRRVG